MKTLLEELKIIQEEVNIEQMIKRIKDLEQMKMTLGKVGENIKIYLSATYVDFDNNKISKINVPLFYNFKFGNAHTTNVPIPDKDPFGNIVIDAGNKDYFVSTPNNTIIRDLKNKFSYKRSIQ